MPKAGIHRHGEKGDQTGRHQQDDETRRDRGYLDTRKDLDHEPKSRDEQGGDRHLAAGG